MNVTLTDLNQYVIGEIASHLDNIGRYYFRMTCKTLRKFIKKPKLSHMDIFWLFLEDLYINFIRIYTYVPYDDKFTALRHSRHNGVYISTNNFNKQFPKIFMRVEAKRKYFTMRDQLSGSLDFNGTRLYFRGNFTTGFNTGYTYWSNISSKQHIKFIKIEKQIINYII